MHVFIYIFSHAVNFKPSGTSFITPRFALHKVSLPTDRRVLITVILKVKSFNSSPPDFQIVQVWRDGDRKRKMIRVESGIFWMDALWLHETDCEWLSWTSECATTHSQRWGWSLCCYYVAVILLLNKLQPNDYSRHQYKQMTKQHWRFFPLQQGFVRWFSATLAAILELPLWSHIQF